MSLVATTASHIADESTPASTTASLHHSSLHSHAGHSTLSQDELNAPSTDSSLYIIDELNRAIPGKNQVFISIENFRQVKTRLDKFINFCTIIDKFRKCCTIIDKFRPT